jgi:hypothetical protein
LEKPDVVDGGAAEVVAGAFVVGADRVNTI